MVEMDRVFAYPFKGYWRDVGTIHSYWESNMGLLKEPPDFDLYDMDWVIHTRSEERPPARVTERGTIICSLISHGSIINGTVEHSVLSPGVFVAEGAVVRDSILFPDCIVGPGSIVDRGILDKHVVVGADVRLGRGRGHATQSHAAAQLAVGHHGGRQGRAHSDRAADRSQLPDRRGRDRARLPALPVLATATSRPSCPAAKRWMSPRVRPPPLGRRRSRRSSPAALAAVEPAPGGASSRQPSRQDALVVAGRRYGLADYRRVLVVGRGQGLGAHGGRRSKTSSASACLVEGSVTVRYGHGVPTRHVRIREAGHPMPDAGGRRGNARDRRRARDATADDLVVCVISGGGSALLTLPADGISLSDLQQTTDALLRSGATHQRDQRRAQAPGHGQRRRTGALRRAGALIDAGAERRGRQSARRDRLWSDRARHLDVCRRRGGVRSVRPVAGAAAVGGRAHPRGRRGRRCPRHPKPGDPLFASTQTVVVGSNLLACRGGGRGGAALGLRSAGADARTSRAKRARSARVLAGVLREIDASGHPLPRPCCVVAGGETTVTMRGKGRGGRNQELALAAAFAAAGARRRPAGEHGYRRQRRSDGRGGRLGRRLDAGSARERGLDPRAALADNDSYTFFDELGGSNLIRTGPTNTNVNDVYLLFAF